MNRYNNDWGYHSPEKTKAFAEALESAGFEVIDQSWSNDEVDALDIEIKDKTYRVWVGDPENPDECMQRNSLVDASKDLEIDEYILPTATIQEIIETLKSYAN